MNQNTIPKNNCGRETAQKMLFDLRMQLGEFAWLLAVAGTLSDGGRSFGYHAHQGHGMKFDTLALQGDGKNVEILLFKGKPTYLKSVGTWIPDKDGRILARISVEVFGRNPEEFSGCDFEGTLVQTDPAMCVQMFSGLKDSGWDILLYESGLATDRNPTEFRWGDIYASRDTLDKNGVIAFVVPFSWCGRAVCVGLRVEDKEEAVLFECELPPDAGLVERVLEVVGKIREEQEAPRPAGGLG